MTEPQLLQFTTHYDVSLTRKQRYLLRQTVKMMHVYHSLLSLGNGEEADRRLRILARTWFDSLEKTKPAEWEQITDALLIADAEERAKNRWKSHLEEVNEAIA